MDREEEEERGEARPVLKLRIKIIDHREHKAREGTAWWLEATRKLLGPKHNRNLYTDKWWILTSKAPIPSTPTSRITLNPKPEARCQRLTRTPPRFSARPTPQEGWSSGLQGFEGL